MGDRLEILEQVFERAASLEGAERAAFLDDVCAGDAELRDEIERMLVADRTPTAELYKNKGTLVDVPARREVVGSYRILSKLGEGGFGQVYVAEQTEPVRRRVALKIIKPGMDSKSVVARFESERQALAVMEHPNIAKVFDGGMTDDGYPYFAMELVKGEPITTFCDRHRLTIEDRLELFMKVCDAVQHAHMKGVIHRDIKPANVLAYYEGDYGKDASRSKIGAKVIDFGVAKALNQRLTERTLFTERGQLIGTPEYMSPEQAEMSGVDIDTRSDVYSLGVLLYELLTGTLPFEAEELRDKGFLEIRRIIREEEPPRPSTKIQSTLALDPASRDRHLQNRQIEVQSLTRKLTSELDWIVLKCLEKDRARRYATPSDLLDDIQRFLEGDSVLARPPSMAYRGMKLAKRHWLALSVSTSFALVLVGAAVVSVGFGLQARHAESALNEQLIEARLKLIDYELLQAIVADSDLLAMHEGQLRVWLHLQNALDEAETLSNEGHECRPQTAARILLALSEWHHRIDDRAKLLDTALRPIADHSLDVLQESAIEQQAGRLIVTPSGTQVSMADSVDIWYGAVARSILDAVALQDSSVLDDEWIAAQGRAALRRLGGRLDDESELLLLSCLVEDGSYSPEEIGVIACAAARQVDPLGVEQAIAIELAWQLIEDSPISALNIAECVKMNPRTFFFDSFSEMTYEAQACEIACFVIHGQWDRARQAIDEYAELAAIEPRPVVSALNRTARRVRQADDQAAHRMFEYLASEAYLTRVFQIAQRDGSDGGENRALRFVDEILDVLLSEDAGEAWHTDLAIQLVEMTLSRIGSMRWGSARTLHNAFDFAYEQSKSAPETRERILEVNRLILGSADAPGKLLPDDWFITALKDLGRLDEVRVLIAPPPDPSTVDQYDATALNNTAWEMLTYPIEELRKPREARELARRALTLLEGKSRPEARRPLIWERPALPLYQVLDTLARAEFQMGNVQDALELQQRAVELMEWDYLPDDDDILSRLLEYEQAAAESLGG